MKNRRGILSEFTDLGKVFIVAGILVAIIVIILVILLFRAFL